MSGLDFLELSGYVNMCIAKIDEISESACGNP
jgi:hypothetical protein